MKNTLYRQAKYIEGIDKNLRDLNSSNQIDVGELQRILFERYESNSVLYDAIQGSQSISQSIEESVEELGKVNKGIRKILPRRKNKQHNERLNQLGELVSEPYHLHTSGIFMPDNLITVGAQVTAMAFVASYAFAKFLMPEMYIDPSPDFLSQNMKMYTTVMPTAMSVLLAPTMGFATNLKRFKGLPTDEAKYLDGKVQEFYK